MTAVALAGIDEIAYSRARLVASEFRMADAVAQKLAQQFGAWERFETPIPEWMLDWFDAQQDLLDAKKDDCLKRIAAEWAGSAVAEHVERTPGLGRAMLLVLSLAPHMGRFDNPAKFWKYIGLHAHRATPNGPPTGENPKADKNQNYSHQLKAWCLFRVAEPVMKMGDRSPYRVVYDRQRAKHPEMLPAGQCAFCDAAYAKRKATGKAGFDCHNMGGPHWKKAHAHIDALGVLAKAITLDAWRISHGLEPHYGATADV